MFPYFTVFSVLFCFSAQHKGIRTNEQYVGCIRNLKLGDELQNLELGERYGDVNMNACPSN